MPKKKAGAANPGPKARLRSLSVAPRRATPGPLPFIPAALDDAGMSAAEFRVYCHIVRRSDGGRRTCTAGIESMAKACRMRADTVRAALKALGARGALETTERSGRSTERRPLPSFGGGAGSRPLPSNTPPERGEAKVIYVNGPTDYNGASKNTPDHASVERGELVCPSAVAVPAGQLGSSSKEWPLSNPLVDRASMEPECKAMAARIAAATGKTFAQVVAAASEWRGRSQRLHVMTDDRLAHTFLRLLAWDRRLRGIPEPEGPHGSRGPWVRS